jgi:thimet oligopeptidase
MLACGLAASQASAAAKINYLHAWEGGNDPAALSVWVDTHLAAAQMDIDKVAKVKGKHTVANTLRPYDDAVNELTLAGNETAVLAMVGTTAPLRDKAQAMTEKISGVSAALGLNHEVYVALSDVSAEGADAATKHYLDRTLLEYRLAGVDKDEATRAHIKELQERITALSLKFGRNVQDDVRKVTVGKDELAGLPDDYIARHKPDANGMYTLTTDAPDQGPVMNFAQSEKLRHDMYLAYNQRAYPANKDILMDILKARQELATVLGYPTYADFATADQMMGNAHNVQAMLDSVDEASRAASQREYAQLLAFAQSKQPGLKDMSTADRSYWMEQYRRAQYDFDAQSVRPYFPYATVQAGILKTAAHLFHVEFKPVKDAKVWDASVDTFDVYDHGKHIGRIYLDMHPREGKDKWFSSDPLVPGIHTKQMPEGMLICNFSGGEKGDPGLMEYGEVVTFFHEFGHLMHHLLGSQGQWAGAGGFNVEGDFVEAPSQMLEEFFRDPKLLGTFAHDPKTGKPIPEALVAKMNAASAFGRGYWTQRQLYFASYSLQLHDRDPSKVDFDAVAADNAKRFMPTTPVEGEHFYAAFTHLTGYASNYYTYVLDKVIALDFFSQFDTKNLLDGPTAMRYRRAVLEPGASKPATELVKDFLGRPQSLDAMKEWIGEENKSQAAK